MSYKLEALQNRLFDRSLRYRNFKTLTYGLSGILTHKATSQVNEIPDRLMPFPNRA